MPAVVTSGDHSQAQRLTGSRNEERAGGCSFDSHRMVQSNIAASVGSGNTTHIAEMYGGLGTPSRVLSGVAVPIAYLDSDPDASDVFESAHPWAATHTCTAREALTSAGDASSFVAVAEHARIAFMGVPCRNLIPMNSHRDEQGDDARQC